MDIGRTTWLTYSCDGDAVTDKSSFEDHRPGGILGNVKYFR